MQEWIDLAYAWLMVHPGPANQTETGETLDSTRLCFSPHFTNYVAILYKHFGTSMLGVFLVGFTSQKPSKVHLALGRQIF